MTIPSLKLWLNYFVIFATAISEREDVNPPKICFKLNNLLPTIASLSYITLYLYHDSSFACSWFSNGQIHRNFLGLSSNAFVSMNPNMSQYITKWKLKFLCQEWIKKYKILSGVRPSAPTPGLEKEIALVQRMAGINVTGELDFETKKLFVIPRCGNTGEAIELSLYGEARQRRRKRDSTDDYLAGACEKLNVSENEKWEMCENANIVRKADTHV